MKAPGLIGGYIEDYDDDEFHEFSFYERVCEYNNLVFDIIISITGS